MGWAVRLALMLWPVGAMAVTPDPHYCKGASSCSYQQAFNFTDPATLDPKAHQLIKDYVESILAPHSNVSWNYWTELHDDVAATLYAITLALSRLYWFDGKSWVRAIDVVEDIIRAEDVRIYAHLDRAFVLKWRAAGAKFKLTTAGGKSESGKFNFNRGDIGGSLHKGFDNQGYTSCCNEPRIQMNYRGVDSLADIDLDITAWYWHFIPNPKHLTYAGSDPRDMYKKIVKKFGHPGFRVRRVKF